MDSQVCMEVFLEPAGWWSVFCSIAESALTARLRKIRVVDPAVALSVFALFLILFSTIHALDLAFVFVFFE